jgi:hypothetical protein
MTSKAIGSRTGRATSICALFIFIRFRTAFVLHSSVVKNIWLALAAALSACASESTDQSTISAGCPLSLPFVYMDQAHRFRVCLPAGLTQETAQNYLVGSVQFTGFALPPKTNLRSKQLLIVSGQYDLLKSAAPFSHFSANGITFERAKFEEGSAGHLTLHVIYTWKRGTNAVHFDFEHRSVNIYNFDPSQRPAEYDRAGQIKITEQIMRTFQKL